MSERRPPTRPGRPGAKGGLRVERPGPVRERVPGRPGESTDESSDPATARPRKPGHIAHGGFDVGADTTSSIHQVGSSDISLIDASEAGPAPSDSGFALPPRAGVFLPPPGASDDAPFSDARSTAAEPHETSDLSTDSMKSAERPVEVRKWRMGGEDAPPAAARPTEAVQAPPRVRTSVVPLPAPLDMAELRHTLEEAERLMVELNVQLSSREGHGARAQLRAALHRIAEALAMLPRT